MPRNPAASHLSTPACISRVAAVCRSVWGVTALGRLARLPRLRVRLCEENETCIHVFGRLLRSATVRTDKTQNVHNESGVHVLADIGTDIGLRRDGRITDISPLLHQDRPELGSRLAASEVPKPNHSDGQR